MVESIVFTQQIPRDHPKEASCGFCQDIDTLLRILSRARRLHSSCKMTEGPTPKRRSHSRWAIDWTDLERIVDEFSIRPSQANESPKLVTFYI